MAHCRSADAALIASTNSVYRAHEDPLHLYTETDPLGDPRAPHSPTYGVSKVSQEAVARTMARVLGLPTTIARITNGCEPLQKVGSPSSRPMRKMASNTDL